MGSSAASRRTSSDASASSADRPAALDWAAYLAYSAWQAAASPWLIASSVLRARKRGYRGSMLRRALQGPWRLTPVDLLIVGAAVGETRLAWLAAEAMAARGVRCAVLAGTTLAGRLEPCEGALAGWAPFSSLPSSLLCLIRYRPKRVWLVRRNERHHLAFLCWAMRIPVEVVDTMLAEDDERRMRRWGPWDRWRVRAIARWCVPDDDQRDRLLRLGVPDARVLVCGPSLGCKVPNDGELRALRAELRARLGATDAAVVVVAGSTHPTDEPVVIEAFRRLRAARKMLVLAPRKADRAVELADRLRESGLRASLWSGGDSMPADAVVIDTVGLLARLYAAGDVAFVGGSFDPRLGGHNPAEPLAVGVPAVVGPFTEQQAPIVAAARAHGVLRVAASAEELVAAWEASLSEPERTERARRWCRSLADSYAELWSNRP
ncbi:MAG: hypothetical protein N2109_06195 [Fimbriimonadales bacterium]|nr:hypothetical protein [Fimbriimonadales bacterium]